MPAVHQDMEVPEYLKSIALGLPGGGFRAAGFSLGILKFLEECDLLHHVEAISAVSGGAITTAKYAECCARGNSFNTFYTQMYAWLKADDLTQNALYTLKEGSRFDYKKKNLINAFALQYEKLFPISFLELRAGLKKHHPQIKDIIFNATDFKHGLQFRFRTKTAPEKFGNGKNYYAEAFNEQVQLSDAVAASSCFPVGFEPISFPDDFVPDHSEDIDVPLMDGGIWDNQGVSSFLTSSDLNYSTYLIADAGDYEIDDMKFYQDSNVARYIALLFNGWLPVVLLFFMALFWWNGVFNIWYHVVFGALAFFGTIQLLIQALLWYGNRKLGIQISSEIPRSKVGLYIMDRFKSLFLLNNVIFLKGSKSKNFGSIYNKAGINVSKLSIYEMILGENGNPIHANNWDKMRELGINISPRLQKASERATNFGTTLWFGEHCEKDGAHILDELILCGRAVCCLSLIQHIAQKEGYVKERYPEFLYFLKEKWEEV